MNVRDLTAFVGRVEQLEQAHAAGPIQKQIKNRLGYLADVGLDYLQLDRPAASLAEGEFQRVILTRTLGSGLVNTLYILDEPTAGLHPHDVGLLIAVLHRLRDQGNSLVVVEHDQDVILASDHVVDLGPGAGASGGQILYTGSIAGLAAAEGSATGDYLSGRKRVPLPDRRRAKSARMVTVKGARGNNLKSIDVTFPLGLLCVVTGVSGSGKSTLVKETLFPALRQRASGEPVSSAPYDVLLVVGEVAQVVLLDQSPLPRSGRSNPATHLKAFDEIRRTFAATHEAKVRNYDAGRFSFNVDGGRCNTCHGNGFLTIDMQFLPDVRLRCPECQGTRYRPEILEVTYRGKNIAEVLDLTARGIVVLPQPAQGSIASAVDARHRPGLFEAGPAAQNALRRRGAAAQAGELPGALAVGPQTPRRTTSHGLPARRAGRRAAPARCREADRGAGVARRARSFRDRHRAQPRGDGFGRLDHRPGPRRRRLRRPLGRGGHAGRRREIANTHRSGPRQGICQDRHGGIVEGRSITRPEWVMSPIFIVCHGAAPEAVSFVSTTLSAIRAGSPSRFSSTRVEPEGVLRSRYRPTPNPVAGRQRR